jgi:hypothetical protein
MLRWRPCWSTSRVDPTSTSRSRLHWEQYADCSTFTLIRPRRSGPVRVLPETGDTLFDTTELSHYGRGSDEWARLAESATAFLIERAKLRKVTSYTELNATLVRRTGLRGFDFDRQDERSAMGHLLGLVVQDNYPETRLMLSALVHYLDSNDAGPGFYALAQEYELLPRGASKATKETFWVGQVSAIHDFYAGTRSRRGDGHR